MNNLTITIHNKVTDEVRVCGKETGAKGYYFAILALGECINYSNRYEGSKGLDEVDVYEGNPQAGVLLGGLKPASERVKQDLLKIACHPNL